MANIVPGAIWQPIDVGSRQARIKGRGAVGHVAVSASPDLVPSGPVDTRPADWHFYLPKIGNPDGSPRFFQYIDLDVQCWATMEGNSTLPAWESEGGLGADAEVNAEPWTENQLQSAAVIYAHLMRTEGAPAQVMPDSRPSSRGLAAHRFGIDPWRVSGGEVWSGPGKLCPGDTKVGQLAEIVARAVAINANQEDPMTPQQAAQLQAVNDAVAKLVVQVGDPTSGVLKRVADLQRAVTALATSVAQIQTNPAPNGGQTIDYAALAKAVNDDAAKRLAS